jgi:HEAT repeat protein
MTTMRRSFFYLVLIGTLAQAAEPLNQRLVSPLPAVRDAAVVEFNQLSRDVQERFIPTLMVGMSSEDSGVHDQSAALLKKLGAAQKTPRDAPVARTVEPADVRETRDAERRDEISRLKTDRYKDLKKELDDEKRAQSPLVDHDAAPKTDLIRDALMDGLTDPIAFVRSRSARRVASIQPPMVEAVPVLIDLLKDPDPECRSSAAGALGAMGPVASDAIPALSHLMSDHDPNVRALAAEAMREVGGRPQ